MVFSSVIFLFLFLPIVLGCYYLLPGREAKNLWLIAASLLFYAFSGLWYVLLLLFSVFCNYLAGLFVSGRKSVLYAAVAVNLGILGIFKYLTFLVQTVDRLPGVTIPVPSIVLPVGILFFTFQGLSYVIDVYRNERLKSTHFRDVLLYIALFPQLVAGPIIRYEDVADEIHSRRNTLEQLAKGLRRFIVGLSKKLLIADICGNVVALIYNADRSVLDSRTAWLAAVCYLMQIYFDFSGYSDMAIGIGEVFGITLPENFEYPYLACSVGEYWRRWHISLSSWFRDYVYIPLGGSRCRLRRTCLNLLIVFALTGLWHGAAWQYVVFGLLHGIILCMERLGLRRALEQLPRLFRHLYTVVLLWLTLVIFGAPGLSEGLAVLKGIFTWQSGAKGYTLAAFADTKLLLILAASFLLCGPVQALCPKLKAALYAKKAPSPAGMAGLLVLLFLGLMRVTAGTYSAFIYFQF